MKMKKTLAILTPGFLPVPSIKGGAVEQLITNFIDENEKYHYYDIYLYTLADKQLDGKKYKYTGIIQVPKRALFFRLMYYLAFKICRIYNRNLGRNYMDYKFAQICDPNSYDKVLVENNMNIFNLIAKKSKKNNLYFHLHNDFDNEDPAKSLKKTKKVIDQSKQIIVVSDFLKKKLKKNGALNVSVVYNSINFSKFTSLKSSECEELRREYGLDKNDIVFTYIGRLEREKGFDRIRKLFSDEDLIQKYRNLKCLVVGNDQNEKKNSNIIYAGYVKNEDIRKVYSISDCILIPTRVEEAFSIVALESLAMGRPIVAADSGALPELLKNTKNIIIPNDKSFDQKLKKTVISLAQDEKLRNEIGLSSRRKSLEYQETLDDYYLKLAKALES